MTAEQARAQAVATVRAQLGLNNTPSSWTYDQRTAYNKALSAYILARPAGFSSTDLGTAAHVASANYQPLENAGWSWAMFGSELQNNLQLGTLRAGWILTATAIIALVLFGILERRR